MSDQPPEVLGPPEDEGNEEDPNPFEMVEEFIETIPVVCHDVGPEDIIMALLAGAAKISCLYAESLELFKAQATIAYERMRLAALQERSFGVASAEPVVDATKEN